jgi:hypothetical protein
MGVREPRAGVLSARYGFAAHCEIQELEGYVMEFMRFHCQWTHTGVGQVYKALWHAFGVVILWWIMCRLGRLLYHGMLII